MSVASQLRILSGKARDKDERKLPTKPTLLFDVNVAADTDSETIYHIALNGLTELIQLDNRFSSFQTTLFKSNPGTFRAFDRAGQDKKANSALNKSITTFLRILSPYLLLKPAHKVLEYLIRQYDIHEHNTEAILECALPYHDSKLFARILQLVKINADARWKFLLSSQKANAPVDKSTLSQRCLTDYGFLEFVFEIPKRQLAHALMPTHYQLALNFYSNIVLEVLNEVKTIPDQLLVVLTTQITDFLKRGDQPDYQTVAFMVAARLSSRVALAPSLTIQFITDAAKHARGNAPTATISRTLSFILVLTQTQELEDSSLSKAWSYIAKFENLVSALKYLTEESRYDISKFLFLFYVQLALNYRSTHALFKTLLTSLLPLSELSFVIEILMETILQGEAEQLDEEISGLISFLDVEYPFQMDEAMKSLAKKLQATKSEHKLQSLAKYLEGTRQQILQKSGTTLTLALEHNAPEIRLSALDSLDSLLEKLHQEAGPEVALSQSQSFSRALLERLQDSDPKVVNRILEIKTLTKICSPQELASGLFQTLNFYELLLTKNWLGIEVMPKVEKDAIVRNCGAILNLLCTQLVQLDAALKQQIVPLLLDNLFAKVPNLQIVRVAIQNASQLCHPLFQNFARVHDEVKNLTQEKSQTCAKINQIVISALVDNLGKTAELLPILLESSSHLGLLVTFKLLESNHDPAFLSKVYNLLSKPLRTILTDSTQQPKLQSEKKLLGVTFQSLLNTPVSKEALLIETIAKLFNSIPITPLSVYDHVHQGFSLPFSAFDSTPNPETPVWVDMLRDIHTTCLAAPKGWTRLDNIIVAYLHHLQQDPFVVFHFLSNFWTSTAMNLVVRTRSLNLANALLTSGILVENVMKESFTGEVIFLISQLLVSIQDDAETIRKASYFCLQSLSHSFNHVNVPKNLALWLRLVHFVLKPKAEVIADANFLLTIFPDFCNREAKKIDELLVDIVQISVAFDRFNRRSEYYMLRFLENVNLSSRLLALKDSRLKVLLQRASDNIYDASVFQALIAFSPENISNRWLLFEEILSSQLELKNIQGQTERAVLHILRRLSPAIWNVLRPNQPEESKTKVIKREERIFAKLCELAFHRDHDVQAAARHVIESLPIKSSYFADNLKRHDQQLEGLISILELLQNKKENLLEINVLIQPLLNILDHVDQIGNMSSIKQDNAEEKKDASKLVFNRREYAKQLNLSILIRIFQQLTPTRSPKSNFSINPIIKCISTLETDTEMLQILTQTRNHALLALTALAQTAPWFVLNGIIALMSQIGQATAQALTLTPHDTFAFSLIQQTFETVIPPLLEHQTGANPISIPSVVQAFITEIVTSLLNYQKVAAPAILRGRSHKAVSWSVSGEDPSFKHRVNLLASLIRTLPPGQLYGAITLLTLQPALFGDFNGKHPGQTQASVLIFKVCKALIQEFEPAQQFEALHRLFVLACSTGTKKDPYFAIVRSIGEANTLQWICLCVHLVKSALPAVHHDPPLDQQKLTEFFEFLISIQNQYVKKEETENKQNATLYGFIRIDFEQVFSQLTRLFTYSGFVSGMTRLLGLANQMKRIAVNLIHEKLMQFAKVDRISAVEAGLLVSLLRPLSTLITQKDEANAGVQQRALDCLDVLTRGFGARPTFHQQFYNLVPEVLSSARSENSTISTSALRCLASLVNELGDVVIPQIPHIYEVVIAVMQATFDSSASAAVHSQLNVLSVFEALFSKAAEFSSKYLPDVIKTLLNPSLLKATELQQQEAKEAQAPEKDKSRLASVLWHTLTVLASKAPPHKLFPLVFSCFSTAVENGDQPTKWLFRLVSEICKHLSAESAKTNFLLIFKFFLLAFDVRRTHTEKFISIDAVEDSIISAFLTFVMKLDEEKLKGMLIKILEGTGIQSPGFTLGLHVDSLLQAKDQKKAQKEDEEEDEEQEEPEHQDEKKVDVKDTKRQLEDFINALPRAVCFFRILDRLAETLKGLFLSYIHSLFDSMLILLRAGPMLVKHFQEVKEPQAKKVKSNLSLNGSSALRLHSQTCTYLVGVLSTCFKYDREVAPALNQEHIINLLGPITNLLNQQYVEMDVETYKAFIHYALVPCLVAMAIKISDASLWKPLSQSILSKSRPDYPIDVRVSAILAIEELFNKLGDQYLVVLAEILPHIAELLDDPNPEVEAAMRRVVKKIEELSGESLDKYLQ